MWPEPGGMQQLTAAARELRFSLEPLAGAEFRFRLARLVAGACLALAFGGLAAGFGWNVVYDHGYPTPFAVVLCPIFAALSLFLTLWVIQSLRPFPDELRIRPEGFTIKYRTGRIVTKEWSNSRPRVEVLDYRQLAGPKPPNTLIVVGVRWTGFPIPSEAFQALADSAAAARVRMETTVPRRHRFGSGPPVVVLLHRFLTTGGS